MEKLKSLNYPLLFVFMYLIKLLIFPALAYDIGIIAVLASIYIINSIKDVVKEIFMEYYKVKQSVISENEFRTQVNHDIATIQSEMSTIKLTTGGIGNLGKRR